jgi:hypothetical protein
MYKNTIEDLINKKEIIIPLTTKNEIETTDEYQFMLKYYQEIGHILINEHTKFKRLLGVMEPGTGKTLFSLNIGYNMAKIYYNQWLIDNKINGYVIILGFTNDIFQDELVNWTNFGFVTHEELIEYKRLRLETSEGKNSDLFMRMNSMLKQRFKNKQYRGFFQFYGYKKFSNYLFILPKNLNLLDYTIDQVIEKIDKGIIKLNNVITDLFKDKNSFIICDEFHELYNSIEKNTYGYAVKIILHYYPETRLLGLTATEINNKATEIIDLFSFLEYNDKAPTYDDIFDKDEKVILPPKNDKIYNFLSNKLFVYRNTSTKDFPNIIEHGEYIEKGKILKFVLCDNSSELSKEEQADLDNEEDSLQLDINIPKFNEDGKIIEYFKSVKSAYLYYHQTKIMNEYIHIDYIENNYYLSGRFLKGKELLKWSSKYYTMWKTLKEQIKKGSGKTFIYHKFITEGINVIQSILLENGFVTEGQSHTDNTLCSKCGMKKIKHNESSLHDFIPCVILVYTGEINKNDKLVIKTKWNYINNKYGYYYMCFLSTIKQSITLLATRNCLIMHKPKDLSEINQIYGRIRRNGSHNQLPEAERVVNYYIFVKKNGKEMIYYINKINEFKKIQQLKIICYKAAFNLYLDYSQINPSENIFDIDIKTIYKNIEEKRETWSKKNVNLHTYRAFYNYNEIVRTFLILKKIFEIKHRFHKKDVYNYFYSFNEVCKYVESYNFEIALYILCYNNKQNIFIMNSHIFNTLLDTNIIVQNNVYKLCFIDPYYCLIPYENNKILIDYIHMNDKLLGHGIYTNRNISLDITKYISKKQEFSYFTMKQHIFKNYINDDMNSNTINEVIVNYDEDTLLNIIKDCIVYVFNILTNQESHMSEFHEYYIKLLLYFDTINIVIYANMLENTDYYDRYKDYVVDSNIYKDLNNDEITVNKIQSLIKSSYSKSFYDLQKYYDKFIQYISSHSSSEHKNTIQKTYKNILVVGFYFKNSIYLSPTRDQEWIKININDIKNKEVYEYVENDIIIGYYEFKKYKIKFQLRNSIHNQKKYNDKRKNEKGFSCFNKTYKFISKICKKLDINIETINKKVLCKEIEKELIKREYDERMQNTNIKWVYHYFE